MTYSSPEVFQEIVDGLILFLKSRHVVLANDRIERSLQSEHIASVYQVLRFNANRVGASHVLFFTVGRPISAWVKLRLQCLDRDGHQLWEETSQKTSWVNSNFHPAIEKLESGIAKRLAQIPLPQTRTPRSN